MRTKVQDYPRPASRAPLGSNIPLVRELFAAIDASGLTMAEIGKKSGVHCRTIQNWRTATNGISLVYLEAVAGAVGLKLTLQQKETKP